MAATEARPVAQFLRRLGLDRDAMVERAIAVQTPLDEPGLTPDAKRVIEAVGRRALDRHREPTPVDLFVALALTPGPARDVLVALGLDEFRLTAISE